MQLHAAKNLYSSWSYHRKRMSRISAWDSVGLFRYCHFFGQFICKNEQKNEKVYKNRLKTIFPLIFTFWSIKQNWSKIQFYLLGPISVIRFVHFPPDISNYFFKKVSGLNTPNQAKYSDNCRNHVNLRT